jgi:hypothetical protein
MRASAAHDVFAGDSAHEYVHDAPRAAARSSQKVFA